MSKKSKLEELVSTFSTRTEPPSKSDSLSHVKQILETWGSDSIEDDDLQTAVENSLERCFSALYQDCVTESHVDELIEILTQTAHMPGFTSRGRLKVLDKLAHSLDSKLLNPGHGDFWDQVQHYLLCVIKQPSFESLDGCYTACLLFWTCVYVLGPEAPITEAQREKVPRLKEFRNAKRKTKRDYLITVLRLRVCRCAHRGTESDFESLTEAWNLFSPLYDTPLEFGIALFYSWVKSAILKSDEVQHEKFLIGGGRWLWESFAGLSMGLQDLSLFHATINDWHVDSLRLGSRSSIGLDKIRILIQSAEQALNDLQGIALVQRIDIVRNLTDSYNLLDPGLKGLTKSVVLWETLHSSITSKDKHGEEHVYLLDRLASGHYHRLCVSRSKEDAGKILEYAKAGLSICPEDNHDVEYSLVKAFFYASTFIGGREGDENWIVAGINAMREIDLSKLSERDKYEHSRLLGEGLSYASLYDKSSDTQDLAIDAIQEALDLDRDRNNGRGDWQTIFLLAKVLHQKYRREPTANSADAERIISLIAEGVRDAVPGDLQTIDALDRGGELMLKRGLATKNPRDVGAAMDLFDEIISTSHVTYYTIKSGFQLGRCFNARGKYKEAFECTRDAVHHMRELSPRAFSKKDAEYQLRSTVPNPSIACVYAILWQCSECTCGNSDDEDSCPLTDHELILGQAFEVLELGRAFISSQSIRDDGEVSRLKAAYPVEHSRYCHAWDQVHAFSEAPIPTTFDASRMGISNEERLRELQINLDEVERDIRSLTGFEHFQSSPSTSEMKQMAEEGPIICINVTVIGSHALAIFPGHGLKVLELPSLEYECVEKYRDMLIGKSGIRQRIASDRTAGKRINQSLMSCLRWLWETTVEPIIKWTCQVNGMEPQQLRNSSSLVPIRWLGTGVMASMPLHAAGIYDVDTFEACHSASQYVLSLYVTSMKAVRQARSRAIPIKDALAKPALFVGMPHTFGMGDISAEKEFDAIRSAFQDNGYPEPIVLQQMSKATVKERLLHSPIAHIACHGSSDTENPSNGGLYLSADPTRTPEHLTIAELSEMVPHNRLLVFLSACSTAENTAQSIPDEAIFTASAFQSLGYPHVLATLWPSDDRACVKIAGLFYRNLLSQCRGMDPSDLDSSFPILAARALHLAVEHLKTQRKPIPGHKPWQDVLIWGPYILISS